MYLYFSDWTKYKHMIPKGAPVGEKIIKTYPSLDNPRGILRNEQLSVVVSPDHPFTETEYFQFGHRGIYSGRNFEDQLKSLHFKELGKMSIRALMRFAYRPETRFVQFAMSHQRDGKWVFQHPFDDLHYDKRPKRLHEKDWRVHLDIFTKDSLTSMRNVVDYDDPTKLVTIEQTAILLRIHKKRGEEKGLLLERDL